MKGRYSTARRFMLGGALLGASVLIGPGCGSSSKGGKPLAGPGSSTATTGGVGSGAMGAGATAPGPGVEITAPAHGAFVTTARATVTGQATDAGHGIKSIKVAGIAATVGEDGAFSADVPLEPGMNTLVVEAFDDAGGRTERHVSVIAGETASEDAMIPGAAAVRLTDSALDMIEPQIAAGIEAQKGAIRQQVLSTKINDVKLTKFDFGKVTSTLDCVAGGLKFQARIADVVVGIEAEAKFLLIFTKKLTGDVRASELTIEGTVMVSAQNGQPVVQVGQVLARADGFSVPDFARDQQGQIQTNFQNAFAAAAAQNLSASLSQTFGAAATKGMTNQSILGKDLEITWSFESLAFDADGATAGMSANVRATTPTYGDGAPGSFVEHGALPALVGGASGGQNVALAVHQDAINRALHAAWRAGALKMDLDQKAFDQLLPGVPTAMNTTALMQAIPALAGVLVPDLPIQLKLESKLPPVVRVPERGQAMLELQMGELEIKLDVIHPTAGAITLVDAIYAAKVAATLASDGTHVKLQPVGNAEIHVDVVGQTAMLPGVEQMMESLTAQAAGPGFQAALAQVKGVQVPAIKGYTLGNMSFQKMERALVVLGQATQAPAGQ